jgi:hypothetical protein
MSQFFISETNGNGPVAPGNYPITPYVVGPEGQAGYQTIQDGLDAANAAGGGIVGVIPGDYTENLTLYDSCHITGLTFADAGGGVNITGVHTPPNSGGFAFNLVRLITATDVFNSLAAGDAHLVIANAEIFVTNGYTFNLPNWTGKLESFDVNSAVSTNDGYINNQGGSEVDIFECSVGMGSANTMQVSGFFLVAGGNIYCPLNITGTSFADVNYSTINNGVSFQNTSSGFFFNCQIEKNSGSAIEMNSSGNWTVANSVIESTTNPSISGTGSGTLTINNVTFTSDVNISGALTSVGSSITPNVNITQSSGNLTLKSTTINSGTNTGFIQTIVNGQIAYIPYFTDIAP